MAAVALPDWLDFRPRLFPSCNFAWLRGPQPVLVDSGFGTDFEATLALLPDERLWLWRQEPARMADHGSRRIFGFALTIHGGFRRSQLAPYLRARRWVHDSAPLAGLPSEEFAERVVSDLLRSGAACWQDDRLISTVPHSRVGS